MLNFLKNHPFAVEAFFEKSVVLTFAVPKEQLQGLIPPCLTLDTFNEKWGFLAIAMVQTRKLRPAGFPELFGNDFFLTGYRIFVRYTTNSGRRLRGLFIIKSETNRRKMQWLGNLFTHYKYTTTDITCSLNNNIHTISSTRSGYSVSFSKSAATHLPAGSPFSTWKEARRYAGPLPFTFTYAKKDHKVLIIEGIREKWIPQPLEVIDQRFDFLDGLRPGGTILANAFIIENIPYKWKKGKTEIWTEKSSREF